MPGKATATRMGDVLRDKVAQLAEGLGLEAKKEVRVARRLWGAKRRIDVVLSHQETGRVLGVECKYQGTTGTAEEKIPATIKDIEHWPIPGIVVIEGAGFSNNMVGYLLSTGKVVWYEDLEDWLRLYFSLKSS